VKHYVIYRKKWKDHIDGVKGDRWPEIRRKKVKVKSLVQALELTIGEDKKKNNTTSQHNTN
jgi:hypothetical protein